MTNTYEAPPIDPDVERSRALLAGLSDLAVAITNHPELASGKVEMHLYAVRDAMAWDAVMAALASYEVVEDDLPNYLRRLVHFGPAVTLKITGPEKEACPHCGRY